MPVYMVQAGGPSGAVKIGWAKDERGRLADLQVSNHELLCIIRTIDGVRATETWFHNHFSRLLIRGEWFSFDPEMLKIVPPRLVERVRAPRIINANPVINLWPSIADFAADAGAPISLAICWKSRCSIPAKWWLRIERGAARRGIVGATVSDLARLRAAAWDARRAHKEAA